MTPLPRRLQPELTFGLIGRFFQMTGRKGRVVRRPDGSVRYESRAEQGLTIDHINVKEKDRFMSGEKVRSCLLPTASAQSEIPSNNPNLSPSPAGGHYLRGSQLWDFPAGRQASEKPEAEGPHDLGTALECRQSHSAVW